MGDDRDLVTAKKGTFSGFTRHKECSLKGASKQLLITTEFKKYDNCKRKPKKACRGLSGLLVF